MFEGKFSSLSIIFILHKFNHKFNQQTEVVLISLKLADSDLIINSILLLQVKGFPSFDSRVQVIYNRLVSICQK